jgi:uncharacterized protein YbjT (DUF2867 family)
VIALRLSTTNEASIKAQPEAAGNDHYRKTHENRPGRESWEIAGIYVSGESSARIFHSFAAQRVVRFSMNILVTGVTGYIGSRLAPRLLREGHSVRGFSRHPESSAYDFPVVAGDAVSGTGLDEALEGIDVAYFLIHSMERSLDGPFAARDHAAAENFARAAQAAGTARIIYLGGLIPHERPLSPHLASRLEVEQTLLQGAPGSVALRASIVIGAGSRPFRFLVRLVERLPVLPMPSWRTRRTTPIDERDMIELLVRAAVNQSIAGEVLDVGGPQEVTYREFIECIRDHLLLGRPTIGLGRITAMALASRVAAVVADEQYELIGPLMESLATDLLAGQTRAAELLGVRLHSLDSAIEHALAEWEATEPLAAR